MKSKNNGLGQPSHENSQLQKHIFESITATGFMDSKLIIRNFGPIKDVNLDLKNINIFIGQQASGKSAIAKIFTIFKTPRHFLFKDYSNKELDGIEFEDKAYNNFIQVLKDFSIHSFLRIDSEILYESELHKIHYKGVRLIYQPKLLIAIGELISLSKDFAANKSQIDANLIPLLEKHLWFRLRTQNLILEKRIAPIEISELIPLLKEAHIGEVLKIIVDIEFDLNMGEAVYIPAERTFANLIKKSVFGLIRNNVPIPGHLLDFAAYLEKIEPQDRKLDFIQKGLRYIHIDGEQRIAINDENNILLSESASGIQSVVPIIDSVFHAKRTSSHASFVIEEPELNLFPLAQYRLIQEIESYRQEAYWEDVGSIHTYTSHSPYVLSCLNNLLYAFKVKKKMHELIENQEELSLAHLEVDKIVSVVINPKYFSAYQISEGMATSIFDRDLGLIKDNYIDEASDVINEDFDKLMELKGDD